MDSILTDLVVRETQAHKISLSRSVVLMASISTLASVCPAAWTLLLSSQPFNGITYVHHLLGCYK